MVATGFLTKVRLCLCLVPGILLGSCSVFRGNGAAAVDKSAMSTAMIAFYSPVNDLGSIVDAISPGLIRSINYPQIDWALPQHLPVTIVELKVHDRQELGNIIKRLESGNAVIKAVRYNQEVQ